MIFGLILTFQLGLSMQIFNLDETDLVLVPVGQTVECQKTSEIHKAHAWVVDDPDIVRLQFKPVKPRSESFKPFGHKKKTGFQVTCTRDCKVGEEFKVKLNNKDLFNEVVKETTDITIRVVEPIQDL